MLATHQLHCVGGTGICIDAHAYRVVSVTRLGSSDLTAEVNAAGRQLLVLSQIYYPGWQATIDGQPAELLSVNAVLQGVVVPPGSHVVKLVFRPASFRLGLIISVVAGLICLIAFLTAWRS